MIMMMMMMIINRYVSSDVDDDDDNNNNNNNNNNRGGHGLEVRGIVVLFLTETRTSPPLQIVQTVSCVHSTSYSAITVVSFPGTKSAEQ